MCHVMKLIYAQHKSNGSYPRERRARCINLLDNELYHKNHIHLNGFEDERE